MSYAVWTTPHSHVYVRCFFRSKELGAILGLGDALRCKITQAAKSIGVEGEIVPGSKASDQVFAHAREQIDALLKEESTLSEEAEGTCALSGEEFRRELTEALADPRWKNLVEHPPWVVGSGKATDGRGDFIVCAKVGDYPRLQQRWVSPEGVMDRTDEPRTVVSCWERT